MPPNNQLALDCPSRIFIEGVQPAKLVKIRGNNAGKVGSSSIWYLYSNLEFRPGFCRAASEAGALDGWG
jgi:hypothetical protein